MKYMGSKSRLAKYILPIILKSRSDSQYFVEPFCGGCNVIDKVTGPRLASDNNKYLIAMWNGLLKGKNYPEIIDRSLYNLARDTYNNRVEKSMDDDLIGWIGFMASANGRFFEGGYSGKSVTKNGSVRDYISESIRNIKSQLDNLRGVELKISDYRELEIPKNSIIYCDIPYKFTKQYSTSKGFNHDEFWNWCRCMKAKGHKLFISEYFAPDDFICVWEKELSSSLRANNLISGSKKSIERLFTI